RDDDGGEIVVSRRVLQSSRALLTLQEQLHATQSALHLSDARDDTHRVQDFGRGLVRVVTLRHRENEAVGLECGLNGAKSARTPSRNGLSEAGKNHRPPKRKNW